MSTLTIHGPAKLSGEIRVAGSKNAALPLIAASLLSDKDWVLHRIPDIEDIHVLLSLVEQLGVSVKREGTTVILNASGLQPIPPAKGVVNRLRASVILAAPLLVRNREVTFPHPGGCIIGRRPIDIFLDGFRAFGVAIEEGESANVLRRQQDHSTTFVMPRVTVTGTETMMLLAVGLPGTHVLQNAALEPEVKQLADTLVAAGADIQGIGTPTLTINGSATPLGAVEATIIPDRLETGTFAMMAAATGSDLRIIECDPTHCEVLLAILKRSGVEFDRTTSELHVHPSPGLRATNIATHEYPGFSTDDQAPYTVLMTQAIGQSLIHETIYEGRLFFVDKLNLMGANILLADPHRAIVNGPTPLRGKEMESPDIRAGIALVIAALAAEGESTIANVYQIDRGYEHIDQRLRAIGANIQRHE